MALAAAGWTASITASNSMASVSFSLPLSSAEASSRTADRSLDHLRAEVVRLQSRVLELEELAHTDPLVLLPNRRALFRDLEKLIAGLDRYGGNASMIFIDVDHLKRINDRFGHQVGDAALIEGCSYTWGEHERV